METKEVYISPAELAALRAPKPDLVATVGGFVAPGEQVEIRHLKKSGLWRAYLIAENYPMNPRAFSWSSEVVRDQYGYIISGSSRDDLIAKLKVEYPNWRWEQESKCRH
jgi:hypothetical protein